MLLHVVDEGQLQCMLQLRWEEMHEAAQTAFQKSIHLRLHTNFLKSWSGLRLRPLWRDCIACLRLECMAVNAVLLGV